ncbi:TMEM175 family protein [Kitasatospora purpeofusca]|uniref:TMEM175 family protein n=1 Tax=Kitasatospora purpeofusca TaxID=67352 RepID=A0ABZ1TSX5_9ACTN|nr:TMEM175 family protein [Kitasatospora purpeofusca]
MTTPTAPEPLLGRPERLVALADGVYAIAITLLAIDIKLPDGLDSAEFHRQLHDLLPQVGAYALSFLVLAAFWRDHHRLFLGVRQVDGLVIRLTLFGLGVAALLPFPTSLIAEYGSEPSAVAIYSAAVAVLGSIQFTLLLVVWKRPWLRVAPLPDREAHAYLADLGATVVAFAATAPLSFLIGSRVVWGWLVLLPVKFAIGRWSGRVSRSDV